MEFIRSQRDQRVVRIFISSTFEDFETERTILASNVFPRVRDHFAERGISIVPIDLRWGLEQNQIDKMGLIDACLDQVIDCYPYFLGLLGSRYGRIISLDEMKKSRLLAEHPISGVFDHPMSITELEFRIGALEAGNEYALLFSSDACKKADKNVTALLDLASKRNLPSIGYKTLEEFEALTYDKLTDLIEARFPDTREEYDVEAAAQEAVFYQHINSYVSGSPVVDKILDHLKRGRNVYLYGEKGVGKSATTAFCAEMLTKSGFDCFLYFCNTGYCLEDTLLLRRVANYFEDTYGYDFELRDEDSIAAISGKMATGFSTSEPASKIVVFIDAVEQIASKRNLWLTLSSIFETCDKVSCMMTGTKNLAGNSALILRGLESEQIRRLVTKELVERGHSLNPSLLRKIETCDASSNPVMLKGILNELSIVGKYSELDRQIDALCNLSNVVSLFECIVSRVCRELTGLGLPSEGVLRAVVFLANVHFGAAENEILAVANLPTFGWISLKNGLASFLVSFDGRFRFNHQLIENAVRQKVKPKLAEETICAAIDEYQSEPHSVARTIELASWALLSNNEVLLSSVVLDARNYPVLNQYDEDGLRKSLSFLARNESVVESQSIQLAKSNSNDAEFLASFCSVLSQSGCVSSCITVVEYFKRRGKANAKMLTTRARAIYQRGDYRIVSSAFREAQQAMIREGLKRTVPYALLLLQNSIAEKSCGRGGQALLMARKASSVFDQLDIISNDSLWCRAFKTALEFAYGHGAKAEDFQDILRAQEELSGESSYAYNRLICYCWQFFLLVGDYCTADKLTSNSLNGLLKTSGEGPDYAWALTNRATVLACMNRREESKWSYRESDRVNAQTATSQMHVYSITSHMNLILLELLDRAESDGIVDALPIAITALKELRTTALTFHEENHPYVINIDANIAILSSLQALSLRNGLGSCDELRAVSERLAAVLDRDNPDSLFLDICAWVLEGREASHDLILRYDALGIKDYVSESLIRGKPLSSLRLVVNNGAALFYVPYDIHTQTRL